MTTPDTTTSTPPPAPGTPADCPDCGQRGERAGHMGCPYPTDEPLDALDAALDPFGPWGAP